MYGRNLLILFLCIYITAGSVNASPMSLEGYSSSIYTGGFNYSIESFSTPTVFYGDDGLQKYEIMSLNPSKIVDSDKYVFYYENFDTDKWRKESYSVYGVDRSVNTVMANETVLYPTLKDQTTHVRYGFNFSEVTESTLLTVKGTRREPVHEFSVWSSPDNSTYTKIMEFEITDVETKQADITNYIKNNRTWIEFRFNRSSQESNIPRILDFSLKISFDKEVNKEVPTLSIFSSVKNNSYIDNFDTDRWKNESYAFYGVDRSVNTVMANETVLYPKLKDQITYIRYRFNVSDITESALLTVKGTRREPVHEFSVWSSPDNSTYTKIMGFEITNIETKQADITNYIKNNQTWIEFRFNRSSLGYNTPRILDFSINTTTHEWRPANITIGGDIELPTRIIDRDHFYYFAPHYPSAAGVTVARIAYLGSKYPAISVDSQRAVLGRFVRNDADLVLTYGTPLSLGSGFVLEVEDMGDKDSQAVVLLKKDGRLLDRGVFEAGKTYSFKTEVEGVKDVELFRADIVSIFRSSFQNRVELSHVYLLDTSATIIKQGDSLGDFEVNLIDFDKDRDTDITIRLKKDRTFTLARDSTIDLFGGLSIKVADSDDMRFAVIKKYIKSGTYWQTGPYGKYGQSYNINSFDAPGLFTYDMDKNDTFESLNISSSTMRINGISYSSLNRNDRIAYLGKTYQTTLSGGKLVLNEILKEENETQILKYGSPLYMEDFVLELLDVGERTALLQLKKGNNVLEKSAVEKGRSFVYKRSIEGKEIEIFNATIKSVFRSDFAAAVEIGKLLLLDDGAVILKDGDKVGNDYEMDITDINGDGAADIMVKLKSGKSFGVSKDSTTDILGRYMSLKAYESTFLPTRSIAFNISTAPRAPAAAPQMTLGAEQAQSSDQEPAGTKDASAGEIQVPNEKDKKDDMDASQDVPMIYIYILGILSAVSLSAATWFRAKK